MSDMSDQTTSAEFISNKHNPQDNNNSSNSGSGGSKRRYGTDWVRKRVAQACDQCRKKKLKCDGVRPICSSCASLSRQCCYGEALKKRGLPEGYVRGLEKLLGLLLSSTTCSIDKSTTLFESAAEDETAATDLIRQLNGDDSEAKDTMQEVWRGSKLCKQLEQLLPLLDDGDNKGHEAKRLCLESRSAGLGSGLRGPAGLSLQLPQQKVAEDLFHIYFTSTHYWLPIIGKDEILAAYYQTVELSETSIGLGEHAALWAVLAYAECQRSPATNERNGISYVQLTAAAESYYDKARSLIPYEGSDLDIGHVQALLVLALVKLALGQLRPSWLLISQAMNILIDIDISNVSDAKFQDPSGRSKNVMLGCFCLDTLLAACMGRRPRLRREDALVLGFLDENGLDEWGPLYLGAHRVGQRHGPSRSLSVFNHLVRLICILNDFALDQVPGDSQERRIEYFRSEFNSWRVSLPAYCSLEAGFDNVLQEMGPHQLNLGATFLICTDISERKLNTSSGPLSEEMRMIRRVIEALSIRSASGPMALLPIFSLVEALNPGDSRPPTNQLVAVKETAPLNYTSVDGERPPGDGHGANNSSGGNPSDPHTISKPPDNSTATQLRAGENPPRSIHKIDIDPSINSTVDNPDQDATMTGSLDWPRVTGLQSVDSRASAGQGNLIAQSSSPMSTGTVSSLGKQVTVDTSIKSNATWLANHPDTYSAALELYQFAQSDHSSQMPHMSNEEGGTALMDNVQAEFSIPNAVTIGELELDPILQNPAGFDDYFFELANLDHFVGDRGKTYRHLGILPPLAFPEDSSTMSHQVWQRSTASQMGRPTGDEKSQWVG